MVVVVVGWMKISFILGMLLRWTCSILHSFSWASVSSPAMSVRYTIHAFRDEDAENATTATINTHTTPKLVGCPLCIMAYYKFLFVYLYCGRPSTQDHHCYTDIIQRSLSAIGCDIFFVRNTHHNIDIHFVLHSLLAGGTLSIMLCVCTLATGFTQNDFLGRRRKTKTLTIILFCTLCWQVVPFPYYGAHCPC